MEVEREDPGVRRSEATMPGEGAVAQVFALKALGWGAKRISQETGVSRNTVRDWLRSGESRRYGGDEGRPGILTPHRDWLRARFHAGVRNSDVLWQELASRGISVSLRTVEREVQPFRQAWDRAQKATMRFETMPGKQMQVDFGEKWLLFGGQRQKRYVFVATLGFSRRCYIEIFGSLRQRDWIMGLEHAFRHFGGVPEEVLTDNAKPLVLGRKGGRPKFQAHQLIAAARHGALEEAITLFARPHLLIIDELGYLPLEREAGHLLFHLIRRRYEKGSLMLTSNQPVGAWGEMLSDEVVATAILDRLLHHSHIVTIKGESYRLREKRRAGIVPRSTRPSLHPLTRCRSAASSSAGGDFFRLTMGDLLRPMSLPTISLRLHARLPETHGHPHPGRGSEMNRPRGAVLRYGLRPSLRPAPRETTVRGSEVLSPGCPLQFHHHNQGGQFSWPEGGQIWCPLTRASIDWKKLLSVLPGDPTLWAADHIGASLPRIASRTSRENLPEMSTGCASLGPAATGKAVVQWITSWATTETASVCSWSFPH